MLHFASSLSKMLACTVNPDYEHGRRYTYTSAGQHCTYDELRILLYKQLKVLPKHFCRLVHEWKLKHD